MATNDHPKMYWPMGKDAIIRKPQLYKDQDVLFTQSGYFTLEEAKKVVESWSKAPSGLSDYWVQVFQGDNHLEDLHEEDLGWNIQLTEKHPKVVEPERKSHLVDDIEADNKRILDILAEYDGDKTIKAGMISRDAVQDSLGHPRDEEQDIVYPITGSVLPESRKKPLSWVEKLTASDRQQLAESILPTKDSDGPVLTRNDMEAE